MTVIVGILAGLLVGLTPFGGGLAVVAMLVLVLGLEPPEAVAVALAVSTLVGAVGAGDGARSRALETTPALWVAAGTVPGAVAGALALATLPPVAWGAFFGLACVLAAIMLWRDAGTTGIRLRAGLLLGASRLPAGRMPVSVSRAHGVALTAAGLVAGMLGGVLGGGMGLVLVPGLARRTVPDRRHALAVGLFAATALGIAGTAAAWWLGHAAGWNFTGLFVLSAVAGFGFARRLAPRLTGGLWPRLAGLGVAAAGAAVMWLGPGM